jgi:hypothetical protein
MRLSWVQEFKLFVMNLYAETSDNRDRQDERAFPHEFRSLGANTQKQSRGSFSEDFDPYLPRDRNSWILWLLGKIPVGDSESDIGFSNNGANLSAGNPRSTIRR